jgi:adenosine deaminase/adenosine deaminase CECR1
LSRIIAVILATTVGAFMPSQTGQAAPMPLDAKLQAVKHRPGELYALLRQMPKGADLHQHLSGGVYAESYIRWAAEEGHCVDTAKAAYVPGPCSGTGIASASQALTTPLLYRRLVDNLSMRNWQPAAGSGHDWFFDRFAAFPELSARRRGEMLAEVRNQAASEGISYLELMLTPDTGLSAFLKGKTWWAGDIEAARQSLLDAGIGDRVAAGSRDLDDIEAEAAKALGCTSGTPQPGCTVEVRYLFQAQRVIPPGPAFARMLMGFLMATGDRRVVGLNLVAPEDDFVSMRDFDLQMRMLGALRKAYPSVRLSLHAGELVPGLVPPSGLRSHIRDSVLVAGASRIGHGVDVLYEDKPYDLLKEMARRKVAVEICLSSNDVILGVRGTAHPLAAYRAHGVPFMFATDDPGIARSWLTLEFARAVTEQGLTYQDLKTAARNSLTYSFLEEPMKAKLKAKLEADFKAFEASL